MGASTPLRPRTRREGARAGVTMARSRRRGGITPQTRRSLCASACLGGSTCLRPPRTRRAAQCAPALTHTCLQTGVDKSPCISTRRRSCHASSLRVRCSYAPRRRRCAPWTRCSRPHRPPRAARGAARARETRAQQRRPKAESQWTQTSGRARAFCSAPLARSSAGPARASQTQTRGACSALRRQPRPEVTTTPPTWRLRRMPRSSAQWQRASRANQRALPLPSGTTSTSASSTVESSWPPTPSMCGRRRPSAAARASMPGNFDESVRIQGS
mmetsp:Transcript_29365/g.78873  ORF Transcript_29365/g.78873 Transcript_29365/m.78873 type:complete len:272 (+) Transcript_29365:689-1504(+)